MRPRAVRSRQSPSRPSQSAQQFGLPREPLDRWHAKAGTERPPDISAGQSIDNHRFLGPEGPVPTVEVHTSFNDERPVVTSVQFLPARPARSRRHDVGHVAAREP